MSNDQGCTCRIGSINYECPRYADDSRRETDDATAARIARELAAMREAAAARPPERVGSATYGPAGGSVLFPSAYGAAQQLRAPGKTFTRSDILAILRGHLALAQQRPAEMNERDAIRALIAVFESLE